MLHLDELLERPILVIVLAALLIILGLLIMNNPRLLSWLVGIGCVLGGIALGAQVLLGGRRYR
ncbi:hypothetical protein [Thermorudis peleae]|uniref:hypothetical protein n=1 Tax=Thermorudis peleae TaxID=1382356 RepID=UPI000572022D|nr:hypothetical protein [Thermorudis peleae]MBX6754313.1 hypothetical protein [Thermorudis peleae]